MKACIPKFPFPPSVNEIYRNTKFGRAKSSSYRKYVRECEEWRLSNLREITKLRSAVEKMGKLNVSYLFHIPSEKIFCQSKALKGKPKRYDVSNRIKACEDQLFSILKIDDSWVFSFQAAKVAAQESFVEIAISRHQGGKDEALLEAN